MDKQLQEARQRINDIDSDLVQLLEQRFDAVISVNQYKKRHHLPILDNSREQRVLDQVTSLASNQATTPYLRAIFQEIMHQSRRYQDNLRKEE